MVSYFVEYSSVGYAGYFFPLDWLWVWGERPQRQKAIISTSLSRAHAVSLIYVLLTSVTGLRSHWPGFSTEKFSLLTASCCPLCKEVTVLSLQLRVGCYPLHKIFGILYGRYISSPLFIHLFISVWTHGYLFYALGYNPVLCYLLCCSAFSIFGQQKLCQLAPESL